MTNELDITQTPEGVRVSILVQPKASRTRVREIHDRCLKIQIAASPVEGQANEELVRFLSKALGVKRSDIRIARGGTSRRKVIELLGVSREDVLGLLPPEEP